MGRTCSGFVTCYDIALVNGKQNNSQCLKMYAEISKVSQMSFKNYNNKVQKASLHERGVWE